MTAAERERAAARAAEACCGAAADAIGSVTVALRREATAASWREACDAGREAAGAIERAGVLATLARDACALYSGGALAAKLAANACGALAEASFGADDPPRGAEARRGSACDARAILRAAEREARRVALAEAGA